MPSMFVSGWDDEEKDDGIQPKDLNDPREKFMTAAENGDLSAVQKMLTENPEFLHAVDCDKYTALHRAAYNNYIDVCKYLLSIGSDPELRTRDGWTVLHCAACWANYEIVGLLLSHGVNVNSRTEGNITPLHLAVNSAEQSGRQILTVKYLLEAPGIDMGVVNGAGDTPLMIARRTSPQIEELLEYRLKHV